MHNAIHFTAIQSLMTGVEFCAVNSYHGEIEAGQSTELDCIISGAFSSRNAQTLIHFIHNNDTSTVTSSLTCKYKESDSTDQNMDPHTTVCARTISTFSSSDSGKYFCTVLMGNGENESFPSRMKEIRVDSDGLGEQTIIAIAASTFGVLLLVALIISVVVNIHLRRKLAGDHRELEPPLGKLPVTIKCYAWQLTWNRHKMLLLHTHKVSGVIIMELLKVLELIIHTEP